MSDENMKAQERAVKLIEAGTGGEDALQLLGRLDHLTAGERMALTAVFFVHGGGPKTMEWRARITGMGVRLAPELRDALNLVCSVRVKRDRAMASEYAQAPWDVAFVAAAEALTSDDGDPRPIRDLVVRALGPGDAGFMATSTRTVKWLAMHVDEVNDEALDGDGKSSPELPVLSDAHLARVRRWLEEKATVGWGLWPEAVPLFPQYPGPMPEVQVVKDGTGWKVKIASVGSAKGTDRDAAIAAAAAMLVRWVESQPLVEGDPDPKKSLVFWVRERIGPGRVVEWLRELLFDRFDDAT